MDRVLPLGAINYSLLAVNLNIKFHLNLFIIFHRDLPSFFTCLMKLMLKQYIQKYIYTKLKYQKVQFSANKIAKERRSTLQCKGMCLRILEPIINNLNDEVQ